MRKLGLLGTYLFITLLIIFLAFEFSQGNSLYCAIHHHQYAQDGFDCSHHVNSFLSANLGNPGTYFFTISLLLILILFFHYAPYLKPEYWVRIADRPAQWIVKKILLISLEILVILYLLFALSGFIFGFSFEWEIQLLFYPIFIFIYSLSVITFFNLIYVLTEKHIIALFTFFFANLIYFNVIDEIAWQIFSGYAPDIYGVTYPTFDNDFIINASIFYTIFISIASFIILIIALKRKECFK